MKNEIIDNAVAKITQEAMVINDGLAIAIEEYLTNRCTTNGIAKKLLEDGKTVQEIHDKLSEKALKQAKPLKGNANAKFAYFDIGEDIDAYYGIENMTGSRTTPRKEQDRVNVLDLF